jgi:hypothetical protein
MAMSESCRIADAVEEWAKSNTTLSAPYGVIRGTGKSTAGRKYECVTFGRARTLDCTVQVFNRNFILVRSSRTGSEVYKNESALMEALGKI